jgi:Tfp pilus assembly protein PilF
VAPAAVHNRVAGGQWILTTSNAGQNFYIGNNPLNASGEYEPLPFVDPNPRHEERGFALEARRRTGRELTPGETSRYWLSEGLRWIRDDPGAWARLTWRKLRNYWGAYEIPDNLDYYLYREEAPVLRLPLPGFGLVAPLGLLGAILSWRRGGWPRLLTLFVAVYSVSVVLFFVFSRFRMAMMPALFVLAGFGAVELLRRCRDALRERRLTGPSARAVALVLALLVLVNLPVRARADSRLFALARAAGLPTRGETSATAHFNLGLVYAAAAKDAEDEVALLGLAERELREALRQETRFAKIHVELGKVLARQGRNGEAIEAYRRAATIEPNDYRTHHALGLLQRREEELWKAEEAFRRALTLNPRHAASANRLGETLLELGRGEEAARAFRHALAIAPGNRTALRGLGIAESAGATGDHPAEGPSE